MVEVDCESVALQRPVRHARAISFHCVQSATAPRQGLVVRFLPAFGGCHEEAGKLYRRHRTDGNVRFGGRYGGKGCAARPQKAYRVCLTDGVIRSKTEPRMAS
jgi:hypothetical protein